MDPKYFINNIIVKNHFLGILETLQRSLKALNVLKKLWFKSPLNVCHKFTFFGTYSIWNFLRSTLQAHSKKYIYLKIRFFALEDPQEILKNTVSWLLSKKKIMG